MDRELKDMSLEELWQLFPIILKEHNIEYSDWYKKEKDSIFSYINAEDIYRINHIGSTIVEGLISKTTIDILLEMNKSFTAIESIIEIFQNNGYMLMSSESTPNMKLAFNKGYTPSGFAEKVFHLHVRYSGDQDELYFRDYLIGNIDVQSEYGELKLSLLKKYKHNRDDYTDAKSEFILSIVKKARIEYGNRYMPK